MVLNKKVTLLVLSRANEKGKKCMHGIRVSLALFDYLVFSPEHFLSSKSIKETGRILSVCYRVL